MHRDREPNRSRPVDNEQQELREFPVPQEQVADGFVEGTDIGDIEEQRKPDLPRGDGGIPEGEEL